MSSGSGRRRPASSFLAALSLVPVALAGLAAAAPGASAAAPGVFVPDALTVVVSGPSGSRLGGPDGSGTTYELRCAPVGGTHPDAAAACDRLESIRLDGGDPFAPVPAGRLCTQIYGGPETAHVTGFWNGRAVDATFDRANGCEIARWRRLVPVLPDMA
ncbi:SSI family serine proteinase inhibitor [Streptomyces fuscigenes]|uniref:SSI family serine proteinase inhibitor n=1 Tax=Streptomyces fuscigenes TaxID=1528880 RepID=UPI001F37033C|nr:SSI family serine proteinase inhibitor [Streptomyces fuscigenes]MCF3961976.1 subtilase-type protease inhibitor [Streptomyces fuscigenes]